MQARAGLAFCGVLVAFGPPCLTAVVMAETGKPAVQFASCSSKVEVFEAVMCLVTAAECSLRPSTRAFAVLFVLGAAWLCVRARRERYEPYLELVSEELVVRSNGRIIRRVDMRLLAHVRRGWNRTVLVMRDGTEAVIDHSPFATSAEVERFRSFIENTLGGDKP